MLKFHGAWRFDSPGPIADGVVREFAVLIGKMASQGNNRKGVLELFKSYFAGAAGLTASYSSSTSWAESDLDDYINRAADNAPLFIEAFYDACEALKQQDFAVPDVARMNRVLFDCEAGYEIRPPDLISGQPQGPIIVPERTLSLDEQAQDIIQKSLKDSEQLLAEGRLRPAVQEILWLLETVSTAFRGLDLGAGTVQGNILTKLLTSFAGTAKETF